MPEQMQQPPQVPQAPPTEGMNENTMCGLAYVTFIPAVVFLVTAPYNQNAKLRFHAWQSILLFCVGVAASIVLAFLFPVFGFGFAYSAYYAIYRLVELALLVLWLVLIVKAFSGKVIKLPIITDLAAKQARFQL